MTDPAAHPPTATSPATSSPDDSPPATDPPAAEPLHTGCGVLRRAGASPWRMPGEDRARFLNGLVTLAVTALEPGAGGYGFLTSAKGRVMADLVVLADDDRFLVELPAAAAEAAREHVLKYRIADRVELEPMADHVILTVAGPRAAEILEGLVGAPPQADWEHRTVELAGVDAHLARRGLAPVPAWDLWLPAAAEAAVHEALAEAGAEEASEAAWDRLRVGAGVPTFGVDFGPDNLPQETGLEESAVSYDKGCYLGQEVVARIHYRGGVNKWLVGLDLASVAGAEPGAEVAYDGRPAGRLGTVDPGGRALAILHQRASEPGTVVEVAGAGEATVVALPFASG